MSNGGKLVLGCGVLAILAVGIFVVMFVGGVWWAKGKVEEKVGSITANSEDVERYTRQANTTPFQAAADGSFSEEQLKRYLEVRKGMYAVYEKYKSQLEAKKAEDVSVSDITKAFGMMGELRLARAKSLATVGMSEAEYEFVTKAIYQAAVANVGQGATGKQMSDVLAESARKANESAQAGLDKVGEVKVEGVGQASKEDVAKAQDAVSKMMAEAAEQAKKLEVPQANIDLCQKYKAEINQYAMSGLAVLGL